MDRIVMFSGGVGSYFAAQRVIERYGADDVLLLFSNVRKEDEDTHRFLLEASAKLGAPIVVVSDGRTPWDVFFDTGFIGNTRVAKCSIELKQKPARRWLKENCDPSETVLYVGIDWTETHRQPGVVNGWSPYTVEFPLCEAPYLLKAQMLDLLEQEGIRRPRLYDQGFPHNNCGGACVKAGQAQWAMVYRNNPALFAEHEANEARFRETFGKDVAILRDRAGGTVKALPLSELRRRLDGNGQIDLQDFGGCGCFLDGE